MDIKESSLRLALEASACRELPPAHREGAGFWIRAVVLVRKRNHTCSYALAERRGDGLVRYVRDFGMMSQIDGLLSVHPYLYLDEGRYVAPYRTDAQRRRALLSHFGEGRREEIEGACGARLEAMVREMGIRLQTGAGAPPLAERVLGSGREALPDAVGADEAARGEAGRVSTDEGPEAMVTLARAKSERGGRRAGNG